MRSLERADLPALSAHLAASAHFQRLLEFETMRLKLLLRHLAGHGHRRFKNHRHFRERQRQHEFVPGFKTQCMAVKDAHWHDGAARELPQLDDARLQLILRATRTIGRDAHIATFFDLIRHHDQRTQALHRLRARSARRFKAKRSADIGDDLAIATRAAQDGPWDMGKPLIMDVRDDKHAIVPKGPDPARACGIKSPSMIHHFKSQRGADAA
jgi:hypothetical protein